MPVRVIGPGIERGVLDPRPAYADHLLPAVAVALRSRALEAAREVSLATSVAVDAMDAGHSNAGHAARTNGHDLVRRVDDG
jgi:hypothetical protein